MRPYKQRHEEIFKTVEIKNYDESKTNNNDQQNEHTVIEPDTQDLPNQVEENVSNSVRDNFFALWPRSNESQPKKELIVHPKVLNLSSVSLTPSQIQISSKGLKFTPALQRNLPKIEKYIKDFTRKRRLVEFFSENPELDTPDSSLLKSKSNFCPPQNRNSTLESVIKFLQKQSFYKDNFKNKSNISKQEWQDVLNLKKNKDIIIKKADKGRAFVIMNTKHCLKVISDHLNDETTYKMVEANCDAKVMKGIAKIIKKYKDNLIKKEREYLTNF